jgi:acyl carrier protein
MEVVNEVRQVLGETLQLGARVEGFSPETPLFGAIAEFDSMAVVTVITALEERFDIYVEDDEIEAEVFATVGSLADFVSHKLEA